MSSSWTCPLAKLPPSRLACPKTPLGSPRSLHSKWSEWPTSVLMGACRSVQLRQWRRERERSQRVCSDSSAHTKQCGRVKQSCSQPLLMDSNLAVLRQAGCCVFFFRQCWCWLNCFWNKGGEFSRHMCRESEQVVLASGFYVTAHMGDSTTGCRISHIVNVH